MSIKRHQWILWLVLVGLTLLVLTRFSSLQKLGATLSQANWLWVAAAGGAHLIYFLGYAYLYQLGLEIVEVKSHFWHVLETFLASLFANAVAPSGGAAGAALFVDEMEAAGHDGAHTAVGTILVLLVDLSTLIPFLIYGTIYLLRRHNLQSYDIVGASIFAFFVVGLTAALVLAWQHPDGLERVMEWIRDAANTVGGWFKHPNLVAKEWPKKNVDSLRDAAGAIGEHVRLLLYALGVAFLLHVINMVGLYFLFPAFSQQVSLGTLTAGFGMGIVFYVVAIVPQGLAAVEGVMALVFTTAGISGSKAAAIVLVFRGFNYWLPLILGFFFLRRMDVWSQGSKDKNQKGKDEQEDKSQKEAKDQSADEQKKRTEKV